MYMFAVTPSLYRLTAARLLEAVGRGNYFSGSVSFPFKGIDCRLTASLVVCRERVELPEGCVDRISDLIPVWWEFTTGVDGRDECNDFSFSDLKEFLFD